MCKIKLSFLTIVSCVFIHALSLYAQALHYVRTVEITTDAEGRGARPEIRFANNRFYIIYLSNLDGGRRAFKVKVFDASLENVLTAKAIVESDTFYGGCTDIRNSADSVGMYLFYEKANAAKDSAYLFAEKYKFDEKFTNIYSYNGPIARGAYWYTAKPGDELLDDPASVIVGDRICVMTKIKGGDLLFNSVPTYRVRELGFCEQPSLYRWFYLSSPARSGTSRSTSESRPEGFEIY
ncbi:MAG: hypothetical protein ACE5NG_18265 [bacterium]